MRRVFKTKTFARWSRRAQLPDSTLCAAVTEMAMDAKLLNRAMVEGELAEICNEEVTPAH
jgi:hypothetical protein